MKQEQLVHKILTFIFDQIQNEQTDEKLAECADACDVASSSLLAAITDNKVRELALQKRNELAAECIRKTVEAIDAIEHGELIAADKDKMN